MSESKCSVRRQSLQVWHINCGSDCLCQMVGKQPVVAKLPAEEVAYKQDRDRRRGACHVSLVGGGWKRFGVTSRFAVPLEPGDTAVRDRHRKSWFFAGDEIYQRPTRILQAIYNVNLDAVSYRMWCSRIRMHCANLFPHWLLPKCLEAAHACR